MTERLLLSFTLVYGSVYMSILVFQCIPPPLPLFAGYRFVFYICDSVSAL